MSAASRSGKAKSLRNLRSLVRGLRLLENVCSPLVELVAKSLASRPEVAIADNSVTPTAGMEVDLPREAAMGGIRRELEPLWNKFEEGLGSDQGFEVVGVGGWMSRERPGIESPSFMLCDIVRVYRHKGGD